MHLQERPSEALRIVKVAERTIPPESVGSDVWYSLMHTSYRQLAVSYLRAGERDSAALCLEELIRVTPHEEERKRLRLDLESLTTPSDTHGR